ncbi:MAG: PfkB family carbohydrate kinase, partial [Phycisphaerales bacterium]
SSMFENEGDELQKIFKIAKKAGATTSCDMTLPDPASSSGKAPWRKILEKILPYIDIFVPSVEETFYMLWPKKFLEMKRLHNNAELIDFLSPGDYSQIADEILKMGCKMTTLKSGHRGFYIKTGSKERFDDMGAAKPCSYDNWSNRELWTPAFEPGHFGSATGSGDSSIAGFLSAFLKGMSIEHALKYAVCCGWQNVQVPDAVSGIKSWEETTTLIQNNMPLIDINCDDKDWIFSDKYQLWAGTNDILNS